jgi:spore coat protein H
MLAMENLTWHWDGYGMNRNNYRVYHEPGSDKIIFCLHGMDQMFWEPKGPIFPPQKGFIAMALMEIPEARQLYHERLKALHQTVFSINSLTNGIERLHRQLRPAVSAQGPEALEAYEANVRSVQEAIEKRVASVS